MPPPRTLELGIRSVDRNHCSRVAPTSFLFLPVHPTYKCPCELRMVYIYRGCRGVPGGAQPPRKSSLRVDV